MKKLIFIASTLVFFACNSKTNQSENKKVVEDIETSITKHGLDISEKGAITVAEFLAQLEGKDSVYAKISAPIEEVCVKKGCWMKINLGEDEKMHVTFKDYEFFVPKDAAGKIAILQGFAKMDTLSIEEVKHLLADANAPQEEIDAVSLPEIKYTFEAEGVIIKEEKLITK